jgi:hypothetical protein
MTTDADIVMLLSFIKQNWLASTTLFAALVSLIVYDYLRLQKKVDGVVSSMTSLTADSTNNIISNYDRLSKVKDSIAELTIKIQHLDVVVGNLSKTTASVDAEMMKMRSSMSAHRDLMNDLIRQSNLLVKIVTKSIDAK